MDAAQSPVPPTVLPSPSQLSHAQQSLHHKLPTNGIGLDSVQHHLTQDIVPGLNAGSQSSRYYGFVTGGATSAATFADNLVTEHDQNVQVHLPNETVCTDVEAAALDLVCDLLDLDAKVWNHRTFTTGATSSNINGLACGREHVIAEAATRIGKKANVSVDGLIAAMRTANIDDIQILTSAPHSSLRKTASILGLGHASVKDVGQQSQPHRIDLAVLEKLLQTPKTASIIAVSCAEVNSGLFATTGTDMARLRSLADKYGAWLHIDAAFGLLARILPSTSDYAIIKRGVQGFELADSIAADAHKLLNVPYDCGIVLSRHLSTATSVFHNPGAPYLNSAAGSIPSPLNIGIENSRRFRALPVYANLVAYGRAGFTDMIQRQIALSRKIASWISNSDAYELLPLQSGYSDEDKLLSVYIIVLFRAKDAELNSTLVKRINATRKLYVSGTSWGGAPASRFAVSNWKVDVDRDWDVIRGVLESVAASSGMEV